mgnify:CR=1 FL=1
MDGCEKKMKKLQLSINDGVGGGGQQQQQQQVSDSTSFTFNKCLFVCLFETFLFTNHLLCFFSGNN